MQWKQIGEKVHMTGPAVANRIQRLEDLGVIEGYTVKLNDKLIGNSYCAFITVVMRNYEHTKFIAFLSNRDEVKEVYRISGEYCFVLKVIVAEFDLLSELLDEILIFGHYKINMSMGQCK
jgi:Lrp/AsnC family leucine-responsive transcriptional regulator